MLRAHRLAASIPVNEFRGRALRFRRRLRCLVFRYPHQPGRRSGNPSEFTSRRPQFPAEFLSRLRCIVVLPDFEEPGTVARPGTGDPGLSTWLYALARNHCLSAIRKPEADAMRFGPAAVLSLRDDRGVAPDRAAEQNEIARRILRLMSHVLEPIEVRVMTLHYAREVPWPRSRGIWA